MAQTNALSRSGNANLKTITDIVCKHRRISEIGEDLVKDGRPIRLVRCLKCGLLIRESIPYTLDDSVVECEDTGLDRT